MKQTLFKAALLFSMAFSLSSVLRAQTKIGGAPGAASPDALLQLGDSLTTKGLLLPRVALSASDLPAPLGAHKAGMTVYNTATAGSPPVNVTPGIYYNDGTQWLRLKIDGGTAVIQGDTLTGDGFITVTGGNGAVLQQANASLNMNPVSDSLSRSLRFVDSLVANTTFRDSIRSLTQVTTDTLSGDNFITVTGGNGAVLQQANASLNMNPVSDSLSRSLRFVDSLVMNTTFRDSIRSLTQVTTDTLSGDNFITVTGGNGAVLQQANASLNMNPVSDSLARSTRFVDSLVTNNTFRDSIQTIVNASADTLSGDNFITVTGGNGAVLQQANASLNMNPVSDSLSRSLRFVDSLVTNTTFRDSIQTIVNASADTLRGDNFITVTGGNGAVLQQANATLNIPAVADTLNKLNLFWGLGGNTGTTAANFIGTTDNTGVSIKANNAQGIYVAPSGSVGIGSGTAPTAALDVNGAARVRTLASGTATDSIVTVDASGNLHKRTVVDVNSKDWSLTGNAGTDTTLNFIGTTDNKSLMLRIDNTASGIIGKGITAIGYKSVNPAATGAANVAVGTNLLPALTSGTQNIALGNNTMTGNTTGTQNIAIGNNTLVANSTGSGTIAIGNNALSTYNSGGGNIALGNGALTSFTSGDGNIAIGRGGQRLEGNVYGNISIGDSVMAYNSNSSYSIGIGYEALKFNKTQGNIGIGFAALRSTTATGNGNYNIAIGSQALTANTTGIFNTGLGWQSQLNNTTGYDNTGLGTTSLQSNTTGFGNTAAGTGALSSVTTGRFNTSLGHFANLVTNTGSYNIVIGSITSALNAGSVSITSNNGLGLSSPGANYEMNIGNTIIGVNIDSALGVGKIGIGTGLGIYNAGTNPNGVSATLDVNGDTRIRNMASGAAADSLVTADANGFLHRRTVSSVVGNIGWLLTGNAGTDTTVNFIGTTDNKSLMFRVNNNNAGYLGINNTALGYQSLSLTATGQQNTAVGAGTLNSATGSFDNVAVGFMALNKNTGNANVAVGSRSLQANTTGNWNGAHGYLVLQSNTTGAHNNGMGASSLQANTSGNYNDAMGGNALFANTTGNGNVAIGHASLSNSISGSNNTVLGYSAGTNITSGSNNILLGGTSTSSNQVNTSSPAANNEMNIGNTLFGTLVDSAVGLGKIGINTRTPSATLHVHGTARIDTLPSGAITDSIVTVDNTVPNGGNLRRRALSDVMASNWQITGNANTTSATNFLGTTNNTSLRIRTNNVERMVIDSLGTVGIGTTAPHTKLHINGSLLAGADSTNTRYLYWNQVTGALASGTSDTAWGNYSAAIGQGNKATGSSAMAQGFRNLATGSQAVAMGNSDTASANTAFAMGNNNNAGGISSATIGSYNQTSAQNAMALGNTNSVSGAYGVALGQTNTVTGTAGVAAGFSNAAAQNAISLGVHNTASGNSSVVIGSQNINDGTLGAAAIGVNHYITTSTAGVAIGNKDTVAANNAIAIGIGNSVATANSIALGTNNTSTAGSGSVTLGLFNANNGQATTVMGSNNTATGQTGTAIGYNNTNSGNYSTVIGNTADVIHNGATVVADNSSVSVRTTSLADNQYTSMFRGGYRMLTNRADTTQGVFIDPNVGGATGAKMGIGTSTPKTTLQVAGSVSANIKTLNAATDVNYTTADNDYFLVIPLVTVATTFNVTMPSAAAMPGRMLYLQVTNSGSLSGVVPGAVTASVKVNTLAGEYFSMPATLIGISPGSVGPAGANNTFTLSGGGYVKIISSGTYWMVSQ